jgi:hypothetical protein
VPRLYTAVQKRARRNDHLLRTFDLSADKWDWLFIRQDCKCAVCRSSDPGRAGATEQSRWHTDHNPKYQKGDPRYVRGILCHWCNRTLTRRHTPQTLRDLADYLEQHQ